VAALAPKPTPKTKIVLEGWQRKVTEVPEIASECRGWGM